MVQPDQKVEASAARAMDNYRRFLELQKTDPQLRAEALRRLGDLNMEAGEGERMAGEASTIDLQGAEAIKLYTSLLKSYPDYPRNDQVLYQLARAYETTGQPEKALTTLDEIAAPVSQGRRRWTKCSSAAASCCSRPGNTARRRTPINTWSPRATRPPSSRRACTNTAGRCSSRA